MMASRAEGFGAEVKRRIMLGTFALSAGYADQYYNQALKVRRLIRNDFDAAFKEVDVLLGPTSPTAAFRIGEKTTIRCRCTSRTSTRSPPTSPASRDEHPLRPDAIRPADRPAAARRRRSPRRTSSVPPASSSARPIGIRDGRGSYVWHWRRFGRDQACWPLDLDRSRSRWTPSARVNALLPSRSVRLTIAPFSDSMRSRSGQEPLSAEAFEPGRSYLLTLRDPQPLRGPSSSRGSERLWTTLNLTMLRDPQESGPILTDFSIGRLNSLRYLPGSSLNPSSN